MGQRLNIEIIVDGDVKSNCYFHWSAYTTSAIEETLKVINNYNNNIKGKVLDPLLIAVKCFYECSSHSFATGKIAYAGLSEESFDFMKEKYKDEKFELATDRNAGIIGCTEDDMNQTRNAEEGRVTIDLDSEMVYFDVLWVNSLEDYIEDMLDCYDDDSDKEQILSYPVFYGNINELSFSQFKVFANFIYKNRSNFISTCDEDTCIISLIE